MSGLCRWFSSSAESLHPLFPGCRVRTAVRYAAPLRGGTGRLSAGIAGMQSQSRIFFGVRDSNSTRREKCTPMIKGSATAIVSHIPHNLVTGLVSFHEPKPEKGSAAQRTFIRSGIWKASGDNFVQQGVSSGSPHVLDLIKKSDREIWTAERKPDSRGATQRHGPPRQMERISRVDRLKIEYSSHEKIHGMKQTRLWMRIQLRMNVNGRMRTDTWMEENTKNTRWHNVVRNGHVRTHLLAFPLLSSRSASQVLPAIAAAVPKYIAIPLQIERQGVRVRHDQSLNECGNW
ncbi:hypothetical protein DFH08DRAFT_1043422 [Mycena albidolilacea]|uniref:Uncharacterized protein n=1 Tax=Mycena albidolilacea TaxID=1033008 RepID=A0AAD7EZI3_9AGAR|nr:hypothetical protein DFH08DRAFT_1043422 [Mycena albidolilacea]